MSELLRHLVELVSVYSPSGREAEVAKVVRDIASELGLSSWIDGVGNVWISFDRNDCRNTDVLIVGHIDTVPGYINVRVEDDVVWGRGAVDAKGPLLAYLHAISRLQITDYRVCLGGLVGEEADSPGANYILKTRFRSRHLFVAEPSGYDGVVIGYRGSLPVQVVCRAVGGHAASPDPSRSAYERFHDAWSVLKSKYGNVQPKKPSMSVTRIVAGDYGNMLPTYLEARLDIRLWSDNEREQILDELRRVFGERGCSVRVLGYTKPVKVKPQQPTPRSLIRSMLRRGIKPRITIKHGTSDMNLIVPEVAQDAVAYGPGDPRLSHSLEERISIKEIMYAIDIIVDAILQLRQWDLSSR
ncbi:MAG TPA: N-acetyl-lysine deacetylase [Pyrodictiaceae archaeon]|nr:N-acetyl-lysine deacetylase [Pyrodictiaceae archaeon]HIQ55563.1 N-acetyl-lysine deacetylase [Pyrodictium sp.]